MIFANPLGNATTSIISLGDGRGIITATPGRIGVISTGVSSNGEVIDTSSDIEFEIKISEGKDTKEKIKTELFVEGEDKTVEKNKSRIGFWSSILNNPLTLGQYMTSIDFILGAGILIILISLIVVARRR